MMPEPLRILCVGDGSPGHEKQTLAMAEAFGRISSVELRWFRVPQGRAFAFYSRIIALTSPILPFFQNSVLKKLGWEEKGFSPHLIMAAGSHTHGILLLFRNYYKARTLICMTPDFWVQKQVDLVLSPFHDGKKQGSVLLHTLGPPCRRSHPSLRNNDQGLILVGGVDASSHIWDTKILIRQIEDLLERKSSMRWEMGSSPRTPEETEDALTLLADKYDSLSFTPFAKTPPGWVESAYAKSTEAWITGDSMSMVYEALTAGCRVGVLPVMWVKKSSKFQRSLDYLHDQGWVLYPGEEATGEPPLLDEATRAAEEAVKRWWGKN
ncbi:ELM1/GtrOC1 family putative glycosyltransferase [Desulfobotulus mexicanus]|uniref:Nucleoside-diphosphate sugar epimerase n=1 Tax=Desulfobotulus mexicanus TaxID=2586642 RepID=A0A5Q4VF75_9BACT|nr:ELM1/GtrOC1 family putative glycosyltransferase [Desulfobotulus mexicanus]TYT75628.1 hypothetical protein FIM25_04105 [Desulfobotulus mexicanus]